jgi:hydroxyacylglutathione hydrolase
MITATGFYVPESFGNYYWLLSKENSDDAVIIDPGTSRAFIDKLDELNKKPVAIMITHHDWDHVDGVEELAGLYGCPVIAPKEEEEGGGNFVIEHVAEDNKPISLLGESIIPLSTPGHVHHHMAYYIPASALLLSGDALFISGCGRLFTNDPALMWGSLCRLRELPDATILCCGHNYTIDNTRFALALEPDNSDLEERYQHFLAAGRKGVLVATSTIGDEKKYNPFLRADDPALQCILEKEGCDPVDVFATIRQRRNDFV